MRRRSAILMLLNHPLLARRFKRSSGVHLRPDTLRLPWLADVEERFGLASTITLLRLMLQLKGPRGLGVSDHSS